MIKELKNPFFNFKDYNCFACGPNNEIGLKLRFFSDTEKNITFSNIKYSDIYSGFPGIIHGGIQTTLLDEVGFWTVYDKLNLFSFTVKMDIRLKDELRSNIDYKLIGKIKDYNNKIAVVKTYIKSLEGKTIVTGLMTYYYMTKDLFLKKFGNIANLDDYKMYLK